MGTEKRERQRANRQLRQAELAKVEHRRHLTRKVLIGVGLFAGLFLLILAIALFTGGDDDEGPPPATAPTAVASSDAAGPATTEPATAPASTAPADTATAVTAPASTAG